MLIFNDVSLPLVWLSEGVDVVCDRKLEAFPQYNVIMCRPSEILFATSV